MSNWIEVNVKVLVHRSDVPTMTKEQEQEFVGAFARELGEYIPTGSDWLDCLSYTLDSIGLPTEAEERQE